MTGTSELRSRLGYAVWDPISHSPVSLRGEKHSRCPLAWAVTWTCFPACWNSDSDQAGEATSDGPLLQAQNIDFGPGTVAGLYRLLQEQGLAKGALVAAPPAPAYPRMDSKHTVTRFLFLLMGIPPEGMSYKLDPYHNSREGIVKMSELWNELCWLAYIDVEGIPMGSNMDFFGLSQGERGGKMLGLFSID